MEFIFAQLGFADTFTRFMILLGWVLDKPLALLFDPFESIVLYVSGQCSPIVSDTR